MNTESSAPQTPLIQNAKTQPFLWSVRREIWENRAIYLAPLIVGVVYLIAYIVGMPHFVQKIRAGLAHSPVDIRDIVEEPFDFAALLMMGTTVIVAVFYCLDALYGERRDRSILFWKSLPVSDLTTVLSKAAVPLLVLPIVTFLATAILQSLMLLFGSIVLSANGVGAAPLWSNAHLISRFSVDLYHLITIHSLWYAPFFAWFILVSAWARRAPLLWAFLPIFAIGFLEKIAFNTTFFLRILLTRFVGEIPQPTNMPQMSPVDPSMPLDFAKFLVSPGLWVGLLITAAFLFLAVRVRRYRDPI